MNKEKTLKLIKLSIMGCLLFFILTFVAMMIYSGGTKLNPEYSHYVFYENFFSDLGQTRTYRGDTNYLPMVLFMISLITIGTSICIMNYVIYNLVKSEKITKIFAFLGIVVGLIAASGFIGVALTPVNLLPYYHFVVVRVAFISIVPMNIIYGIIFFVDGRMPKIYPTLLMLEVFTSIIYMLILFSVIPVLSTIDQTVFNSVSQKVIIYLSIFTYLIVFIGMRKHLDNFSELE